MKLTTPMRNAIPTSQFAGPKRSFPIPDLSHARAALSMAHYAPDPGAIKAAVHQKFPTIGAPEKRQAIMARLKGLGK
jgi:hypothetical protein